MSDREKAFCELVKRNQDLIWNICSSYRLSAAWETEDAFQEVLYVIWRDMDSFEGRSSERTWIFRVATSTMLMIKRRLINQPQEGASPETVEEQSPDTEDYDHLLQLIDQLDEKDAQIVHAHLQGYNQKEIAELLGCSIPTVARRMAKAKKWLNEHFEK